MLTNIRARYLLVLLGLVAVVAIACGTDDAPAAGPSGGSGGAPAEIDRVVVDAPIDAANVAVSPGDPPIYTLEVTSGLPSGCAAFNDIETSRDGSNVVVHITNTMPSPSGEPIACTEIYGMVENSVPLPGEFERGADYTVTVNGLVKNFKGLAASDFSIEPPDGLNQADFIFGQLERRDPDATRGDEVLQPFFDVTGEVMNVFGEAIQVFVYDSTDDARAVATGISPDGSIKSSDGSISMPMWIAPPHFYQRAEAIVLYIGENESVMDLLDEIGADKIDGSEQLPFVPADDSLAEIDTLDEFKTLLEDLSTGDAVESGVLGAPTLIVQLNGEELQVSIFPSAEDAKLAADRVTPDATTIFGDDGTVSSYNWVSTPHFYLAEEIITLYIGTNDGILDLLDRAAGENFADGERLLIPQPDDQRHSGIPDGFVALEAPIEAVEIEILESFPPQYIARITVGLPSGCVTFGMSTVKRDGRIVSIQMLNKRPADAEICTTIYGIEDIRVPLEGPFEPGVEFDVIVNGERHGTFVGQG